MTGRAGRVSWKARAEEASFEMLPKRCNRRTLSYMERERVPKDRGIVTGITKVFNGFVNSTIKCGGLKELEFGGTSPCISKGGVGVD